MDSFYIDFKDDYELSHKMADIINDIAGKAAHIEDRKFLTGFSMLSKRKRKRIRKWVFRALEKAEKKNRKRRYRMDEMLPTLKEIKQMSVSDAWKLINDECFDNYKLKTKINGITALNSKERQLCVACMRLAIALDKEIKKENKLC